jgi:hypothetical protein
MSHDNTAKDLGAPAAATGYDRVNIPQANGTMKTLTRRQFEALPLKERVAYLLDGTAQFFLGNQQIPARDAMKG